MRFDEPPDYWGLRTLIVAMARGAHLVLDEHFDWVTTATPRTHPSVIAGPPVAVPANTAPYNFPPASMTVGSTPIPPRKGAPPGGAGSAAAELLRLALLVPGAQPEPINAVPAPAPATAAAAVGGDASSPAQVTLPSRPGPSMMSAALPAVTHLQHMQQPQPQHPLGATVAQQQQHSGGGAGHKQSRDHELLPEGGAGGSGAATGGGGGAGGDSSRRGAHPAWAVVSSADPRAAGAGVPSPPTAAGGLPGGSSHGYSLPHGGGAVDAGGAAPAWRHPAAFAGFPGVRAPLPVCFGGPPAPAAAAATAAPTAPAAGPDGASPAQYAHTPTFADAVAGLTRAPLLPADDAMLVDGGAGGPATAPHDGFGGAEADGLALATGATAAPTLAGGRMLSFCITPADGRVSTDASGRIGHPGGPGDEPSPQCVVDDLPLHVAPGPLGRGGPVSPQRGLGGAGGSRLRVCSGADEMMGTPVAAAPAVTGATATRAGLRRRSPPFVGIAEPGAMQDDDGGGGDDDGDAATPAATRASPTTPRLGASGGRGRAAELMAPAGTAAMMRQQVGQQPLPQQLLCPVAISDSPAGDTSGGYAGGEDRRLMRGSGGAVSATVAADSVQRYDSGASTAPVSAQQRMASTVSAVTTM